MLTLVASLLLQSAIHDVEKWGRFEAKAVALTDPSSKFLETCVRIFGELPLKGTWCLKVISVTNADGSHAPVAEPLTGAGDVTTSGYGLTGYSSLKVENPPDGLRLTGELVHYRGIEETATFPTVRLQTRRTEPRVGPPNRDWFVPEGNRSTAKTSRGLVLRFAKMSGYGYSGPGYDDLSRLPVKVDLPSLNKGVESELAGLGEKSVDRVEAYTSPERILTLFEPAAKVEYNTFTFMNREFSQDVQLSLHVIRQIVDRRYKFNFVVPVQRNKDLDEEHKYSPDKAKIVIWPPFAEAATRQPGPPLSMSRLSRKSS